MGKEVGETSAIYICRETHNIDVDSLLLILYIGNMTCMLQNSIMKLLYDSIDQK